MQHRPRGIGFSGDSENVVLRFVHIRHPSRAYLFFTFIYNSSIILPYYININVINIQPFGEDSRHNTVKSANKV